MNKIIDDVWIDTFQFLSVHDFLSIACSCKHFNTLTNHKKNHRINQYWESKCKQLCTNIETNKFTTNDWHAFYIELFTFINDHLNDGCMTVHKQISNSTLNVTLHRKKVEKERMHSYRNNGDVLPYILDDDCLLLLQMFFPNNVEHHGVDYDADSNENTNCNTSDQDESNDNDAITGTTDSAINKTKVTSNIGAIPLLNYSYLHQ